MDVLADVVAATRLRGKVFCRSELHAPWGMRFPAGPPAGFHAVVDGSCLLLTDGGPPLPLHEGDVVLLPLGAPHRLVSDLDAAAAPVEELIASHMKHADPDAPRVLRFGGSGARTTLLCGAYWFEGEGGEHPLFRLLPEIIHLPARGAGLPKALEDALRILVGEYTAPGPGSAAVVSWLVDLVFVLILRRWIEGQPQGGAGWLGALRDPRIGKSLARMHEQIARDWSLDELAAVSGMSRAAFARRFKELVGEAPLAYLTRWRLVVAARLLEETDAPIAEIAARVGYDSEFAFSRAFRRAHGAPPGRHRQDMLAAARERQSRGWADALSSLSA